MSVLPYGHQVSRMPSDPAHTTSPAVHAGREPKLTGPYKETDPFHDPLVTFAYLAGITRKLEMATG